MLRHDEVVAEACEEPCGGKRGAEGAHCCSQVDGGEEEVKMRRGVEEVGRAAGSARMERADAGLG